MKITRDDVVATIKEANIEVDARKLNPEIALTEQGLDSLDMMNLFFTLEEKYNIKIDEGEINSNSFSYIDGIVKRVKEIINRSQ